MKRLCIDMTLWSFTFDFIVSLEIESTWQRLTDTGTITLPNNIRLSKQQAAQISAVVEATLGFTPKLDRNNLREILKPGEKVLISLGYDDSYEKIFDGYVVAIKPSTPIEISVEDWMYELKKGSIKETIKSAKLSTLVKKYFASMTTSYDDVEIGTIVIDKLSPARLLDKLRESYGIYCFIRGGKLVLGKIYDPSTATTHKFRLQGNIIEDGLEYRRKEDMKLMVSAISTTPSGKVLEVKVGENEGEERKLQYYNVSKDALKKYAQKEYDRLKYDGFHGDFTTFGEPLVRHGDIVTLDHPQYSDKTGDYWVDKVIYKFGKDGFRQVITLGPKK